MGPGVVRSGIMRRVGRLATQALLWLTVAVILYAALLGVQVQDGLPR